MMKDILINVSKTTRKIDVEKSLIGNDGENLQGNIVFKFKDEFVEGIARLEYTIKGENKYILLAKQEDSYIIPIKSVLAKEGQINMQLVITEEEKEEGIPIFKSNVFYVYCNKSINAEIEQPEEYEGWIEIANQNMIKMNKIITEAEQMEREALKLDEDVKQLEQDINNIDIEVNELNNNINLIANDIDTHTEEINGLEQNYNMLHTELLEQEETINHLDDTKTDRNEIPNVSHFITKSVNNLDNYYTKEENDEKLKGYASTSSLIAGINGCEPKLANTVDYVIETGLYGDGESGYRKYKNGFIEQWGVATTQTNETEFRMHQSHINQNFSIFIEPREIGNFYHYAMPSANQKFKCRIQSRDSASMAIKFQWRSYGKWK